MSIKHNTLAVLVQYDDDQLAELQQRAKAAKVIRTSVLDLLRDGPMKAEEIATELQCDLEVVKRALVFHYRQGTIARGFFEKDGDRGPTEYYGFPKLESEGQTA